MVSNGIIDRIVRISSDVRQYTIKLEEGKFSGEAGQYTIIKIPDSEVNGGKTREYSVIAVDDRRIILMIRGYEEGDVSKYLAQCNVGDRVVVESDLSGDLTIKSEITDSVFICTGTGITPLLGILHRFVQNEAGDAVFMLGEKTKDQLLYKSLLEQYEVLYDVETVFSLSQEEWYGREGYIQTHLEDIIHSFENKEYYICGVPEMVVDTKQRLFEFGVDEKNVHTEGWEDAVVDNR